MAQQINDIMTKRLVTVGVQTPLVEAARLMRDTDIGDVLVVDDGRLRGILTDRDMVVRGVAENKDLENTTVQDVCSPDLVTVRPDDDAGRAVDLMRQHALRRLPVTEADDHLVGIVTLGDLAVERDEQSALADISSAAANS